MLKWLHFHDASAQEQPTEQVGFTGEARAVSAGSFRARDGPAEAEWVRLHERASNHRIRAVFFAGVALLVSMTKATACKLELAMSYDQMAYHRERERHCREMAETAADPDVRRRHEELADLHARRASEAVDSRP